MAARAFVLLALLLICPPLGAELATERYAPAQLQVGQNMLERARAAAAVGEYARAGRLAWQAGLDARLTWQMTESPELRADAAELGAAAAELISHLNNP